MRMVTDIANGFRRNVDMFYVILSFSNQPEMKEYKKLNQNVRYSIIYHGGIKKGRIGKKV